MFPHDPEESMKYLCLIYSEEAEFPKMPKAEADKWMSEYMEFTDRITKSGHYVGANRLHPTQAVPRRSRAAPPESSRPPGGRR